MEFGRVPKENLKTIDFALKSDNSLNARVLSEVKSRNEQVHSENEWKPNVYVGCPEWSITEWKGKIYPGNAKSPDFLSHYARQFNTIELNLTHYRIPTESDILKWNTQTAEGFKFCPKFPQIISHDKKLRNADPETGEFCERVLDLGGKLGSSFLQLSPFFSPRQFPELEKFLRALPARLPVSVEFRHEDWFKNDRIWEETLLMLQSLDMGTVITDVAGRRDVVHQGLSNSSIMLRWVGNDHESDYDRIDAWIHRLKQWVAEGLQDIYIFVHISDNILAPEFCHYWIKKLNAELQLSLKEPVFFPKTDQLSLF